MPAAAQPRTSHPPLAHDARGVPIPIPDSTIALRVKRQTAGRPKVVVGPDRQPLRLPLDTTAADLLDMCGAGTYRLDAIDDAGQVVDFITTISVGSDVIEPSEAEPLIIGGGRGGSSSDLRYALETTAHMARAQSEALRSIAGAQADWIKGLANAKVLHHRNGMWPPVPPASPMGNDEDDDSEEEEEEEEEDDDEDGPRDPMAGVNTMLGHVAGIAQHVSPLLRPFLPQEPRNAAAPPAPPAAAPAAPPAAEPVRNAAPSHDATASALHLVAILDRLSPEAVRIARGILGGKKARARELAEVLAGLSVKEAVTELEILADDVTRRRPSEPSATAPRVDFAAQLEAVKALLTPVEIVQVMAMIAAAAPESVERLKAMLVQMAPEDAAAWVRERLAPASSTSSTSEGGVDGGR